VHVRYGLTTSFGELDGSRHTSGAKASRSTHSAGGALRVGLGDGRRRLRCSAGVTDRGCATGMTAGCRVLRARLQNFEAAHGHRDGPGHHEVAQGRADAAYSAAPVRRSGRVSVHDRGNETTLLDLLITRRSREAANAWSSLSGYLPDRLGDGPL
jgi:hypothetical protein